MTGRRILLGRHVRVLEETTEGIRLEGHTRLRPGQLVDLVTVGGDGATVPVRSAWVVSWAIAKLGKEGPTYNGLCRWQ